MRIFLSYHFERGPLVRDIKQHLPAHVRPWIAENDLLIGENLPFSIRAAIQEGADFVVIFVDPKAIKSKWVQQELEWALQREDALGRPFVLPIVLDRNAWSKVEPSRLKLRKYIECYRFEDADARFVANELTYQLFAWLSRDVEGLRAVGRKGAGLKWNLIAESESPLFEDIAKQTVLTAKRVVLIGTGLNLLQKDPFTKSLIQRVVHGECELEVYFADPQSPAVETRLIEEELGDTPPRVGASGLRNRIGTLLKVRQDCNCAAHFKIGLFTHYPTFALLIADDHYFVYPYGYALLGNYSPVLHFLKTDEAMKPLIDFLEYQYQRVKSDARDAQLVFDVRDHRLRTNAALGSLTAFALYIVPPPDSDLYRFGSEILGYNVYEQSPVNSTWRDKVGSARDFGFHLTVCDALYFSSQQDARVARNEVVYLARQLRPFDLDHLQVKPRTPDDTSVSIVADDPSGFLEAIHVEVVFRIYRRALASNYTLGLTSVTRDQSFGRAELMIQRYLAPYILKCFRPHLTLLTMVDPEEQDSIVKRLESELAARVRDRVLRVERLAIMIRPDPKKPWEIESEVPLG